MWRLFVDEGILADLWSRSEGELERATVTVRVADIRDGTLGVSLLVEGVVAGEWTDYGAQSVVLTAEGKVGVCGREGTFRYLLEMPRRVLRAQQLADNEVELVLKL